jgi:hypothetical protein
MSCLGVSNTETDNIDILLIVMFIGGADYHFDGVSGWLAMSVHLLAALPNFSSIATSRHNVGSSGRY